MARRNGAERKKHLALWHRASTLVHGERPGCDEKATHGFRLCLCVSMVK